MGYLLCWQGFFGATFHDKEGLVGAVGVAARTITVELVHGDASLAQARLQQGLVIRVVSASWIAGFPIRGCLVHARSYKPLCRREVRPLVLNLLPLEQQGPGERALILGRVAAPHRDLKPIRVTSGLTLIALFRGPDGLALESLNLQRRQVQTLGVSLRPRRIAEVPTRPSPIHPVIPCTRLQLHHCPSHLTI